MSKQILRILEREPIRRADGRYSAGFVDLDDLQRLIDAGEIEVYDNQCVAFVRRRSSPKDRTEEAVRSAIYQVLDAYGYARPTLCDDLVKVVKPFIKSAD